MARLLSTDEHERLLANARALWDFHDLICQAAEFYHDKELYESAVQILDKYGLEVNEQAAKAS